MIKTYRIDLSAELGRIPLTREDADLLSYVSGKVRGQSSCVFSSSMTEEQVEEIIDGALASLKGRLLEQSRRVLDKND